jgi:hypothetical protein
MPVHFSAETSAVLTDLACSFPQLLQTNAGVVCQVGVTTVSFQIPVSSLFTNPTDDVYCELLTALLNKEQKRLNLVLRRFGAVRAEILRWIFWDVTVCRWIFWDMTVCRSIF